MSKMATEAPNSVSRKAVAAPMPEPPPTTTASLSANSLLSVAYYPLLYCPLMALLPFPPS